MTRSIWLFMLLMPLPAYASQATPFSPDVRDCVRFLLSANGELREIYSGRLEDAMADLQSVEKHDLNGDGREEYFLAFGMGCGSGGCQWHIVERTGEKMRLLLVSEGNYRVGPRRGGGYKPLTFTFGGGMSSATETTYAYSSGGYRQTGCFNIDRKQRGSRWVVVSRTPCS